MMAYDQVRWLEAHGSSAERQLAREVRLWRESRWLCETCQNPRCEGTHVVRGDPSLIVDEHGRPLREGGEGSGSDG